ncbi:uncharacterized protein LOC143355531 [Halictus rubicundus]|uniref:uncharacterized protein LOC143355531 n=1 Tax=Halictus rubicundus TaxID=77578 RepID=UPI0040370E99
MSTFQRHYKAKTLGFGDPAVARVTRAKTQEQARKTCRSRAYTENRNIRNISSHVSGSTSNKEIEEPPAPEDRMTRLLNWKKSRQIQRKLEKIKMKQPFVVRAVDKNIFALPMNRKDEKPPTKSMTPPPKKITKATQKRIMHRAQASKVVKPSAKSPQPTPEKECTIAECHDHNPKPSERLDQEPLFGRTCLSFKQLFKKDIDNSNVETHNNDNSFQLEHVDINKKPIFNSPVANEPIFFSPYVVSSRGKSNARNEQRMKRGFSLSHSSDDDIPTKETVMKNLNISVEEEERTAQYFQFLLSKEVDRLNELCDKWTTIKEEPDTTEDGQYQINQAVGQTNLLISKKFERFRRLVTDCETGKGKMLVTCKDLQGFWDMMYMEIRNCDSRFDKLEHLHSQGWKEEDLYDAKKLPAKKKAAVKKKMVPKQASSVIAFMKEKRKKMMEEAANTSSIKYEILDTKGKTKRSVGPSDNKRSLINKHDKRRSSLLQKVQLSATKKPVSPLTIMKISQMCKTPEVKLDSTISYINSDQTPGKSILKQPKKSNEIESCTKSYKVNFNDTITLNEVPIDEETQTKMELAAALARIDRLEFNDSIEDEPVHVEKRLTFDDSSCDECEDAFDTNAHSEKIESTAETMNITPVEIEGATSLEPLTLRNNSISQLRKRRLRRETALDISDTMLDIVFPPSSNGIVNGVDLNVTQTLESEEKTHEYTENIRVLRNRSITSSNIPTPRRRSTKMSTHKQESQYKENIDSKDDLSNDIPTISLNEESKTRKSRSIKFSEKECNTYREKTAFPLTPHTRRSKILSSEKKRRTTFVNSVSTSSPVKPPERIRKSLNRISSATF